mmetsp:Transcript_5726/g.10427  ORF Transcript_5726/g.10427 Transcript_5726/m.10427 type:complete len:209 (+) Transcript_5726:2563-3189(+)
MRSSGMQLSRSKTKNPRKYVVRIFSASMMILSSSPTDPVKNVLITSSMKKLSMTVLYTSRLSPNSFHPNERGMVIITIKMRSEISTPQTISPNDFGCSRNLSLPMVGVLRLLSRGARKRLLANRDDLSNAFGRCFFLGAALSSFVALSFRAPDRTILRNCFRLILPSPSLSPKSTKDPANSIGRLIKWNRSSFSPNSSSACFTSLRSR